MKFILSFILVFLFVSANAQIDSVKITQDTLAISKKQSDLIDVKDYIIKQSALDSTKLILEKELNDLNKTQQEKKKINDDIKRINKKKDSLTQSLTFIQESIANASTELEKLKENTVKLTKYTDSLNKKSDTLNKKNAIIQQQSDSLANKVNSAQADLNKLLTEIAQKEDSLEAIAIIKLKPKGLMLRGNTNQYLNMPSSTKDTLADLFYQYNTKAISFDSLKVRIKNLSSTITLDTNKIRKVNLFVKEGRIVEIVVDTEKGVFRNTLCQIDLVHFSERMFSDLLYLDSESPKQRLKCFMYPGDAIQYKPIRSFADVPYSEFEITLTPDSSNNQYIIRENTSINTYFDVAVFTDIKGISGDANGLAQIAACAKFITSTRNKPNKCLMGFQYVAFMGGLSKFDNDFKGTYITSTDSINRKDLFQRAQYSVGVKLNVLHWVRSPQPRLWIQDIQINTGFNFVGSRVADSIQKKNDTLYRTVTHNQIFLEPIISFSRQKNFSMTLALPLYYQNLKESSNIKNNDWEWWISPSINLMYYSKRDSKSKIFFRYNHYVNLKEKKFAFYQMQLGFATSLTGAMQGK